uniref:Uncharacterized protein n=1 Tax=viral metagenome TaxID=1070528 RepID=A0A6C0HJ83_9ZZZZ
MARQKKIYRKTSGDDKSAPRRELGKKAARMSPFKEDSPVQKAARKKEDAPVQKAARKKEDSPVQKAAPPRMTPLKEDKAKAAKKEVDVAK